MAVKAAQVIEAKLFAKDFTPQQHQIHFKRLTDLDLKKLASITGECDKIELIFDDVRYLRGQDHGKQRLEMIRSLRDRETPTVRILLVEPEGDDYMIEYIS